MTDVLISVGVDTGPAASSLDLLGQSFDALAAKYGSLNGQFAAGLAPLNSSLQSLASSVNGLNATMTRLSVTSQQAAQNWGQQATAQATARKSVDDYGASLARLDAQLGLISRSDAAYAQVHAQLSKMLQQGSIDQDQFNSRVARAAQVYGDTGKAAANAGLGTAGMTREVIVLGHEMVSGNFSRIPGTLLVLASRMGGVTLAGVATTAAFVGLGAAMVYPIVHAIEMESQLRTLNTQLSATGNTANVTAEKLRDMANAVAGDRMASRSSALAAATAIAANNTVAPNVNLQTMTQAAADFAQVTGQEVPQATARLIQALEGSYQGILKLNDAYPTLTQVELQNIKTMVDHGDTAGAMRLAVEGMERGFHNAAIGGVSEMDQAAHNLANSWHTLMDTISNTAPYQAAASAIETIVSGSLRNLNDAILGISALIEKLPGSKGNQAQLAYLLATGNQATSQPNPNGWHDLLNGGQLVNSSGTPINPNGSPITAPAKPGAQTNADVISSAKMQAQALSQVGMAAELAQAHIANLAKVEADATGKLNINTLDEASRIQITAKYAQQASLMVTNLDLQAEAQDRLTAAVGQGWQAQAQAEAANKVADEQAQGHAVNVQALTDAYMRAAAAKANYSGAQFVAGLEQEATAATNLANAHRLGGAAIADATIQNQLNAQSLKGLGADQAALADSLLHTIEVRKEEAQAGDLAKKLDDEAQILQLQVSLMGQSKKLRQDQVNLLTQELALRRQFPNLDQKDLDALVQKMRANEQVKEQVDQQIQQQQQLQQTAKQITDEIGSNVRTGIYDMMTGKNTDVWAQFKDLGLHAIADVVAKLAETEFIMPVVADMMGVNGGTAGGSSGLGGSSSGGLGSAIGLMQQGSAISGMMGGSTLGSATSSLWGTSGSASGALFGNAGDPMVTGLSSEGLLGSGGLSPELVGSAGDPMVTGMSGQGLIGAGGDVGAGGFGALGSMLPGIGAGFMGGAIVGQATHSTTAGAIGGMASGAAIGMMMGGPWGAAAGALVGLVSGIINGQHLSVGPDSAADSTLANGQIGVGATSADNGGDAAGAVKLLTQFSTATNDIVGALGGTIQAMPSIQVGSFKGKYEVSAPGNNAGPGVNGGSDFSDVQAAAGDFIRKVLASGTISGLSDDVQTAIAHISSSMSATDIAADLQFANQYKDTLLALNTGVQDYTKNAKLAADATAQGLIKQMQDLRTNTTTAGLNLDDMNAAIKNWTNGLTEAKPVQDAITLATEQAKAQWDAMIPVFVAAGDTAEEAAQKVTTGLNTALQQIAQTVQQDVNSITGLGNINSLYTLAPQLTTATGPALTDVSAQIGGVLHGLSESGLITALSQFGDSSTNSAAYVSTMKVLIEEQLKQVAAQKAQTDTLNAATNVLSTFNSALSSLTNFYTGLSTGNLSPLSPQAQLNSAQTTYQTDLTAARGGDAAALSRIQGDAQTYLTTGQKYYASGPAYSDPTSGIFTTVQADIKALTDGLKSSSGSLSISGQQSLVDSLNNKVSGVTGALANLSPALQSEVSAILAVNSSVQSAGNTVAVTLADVSTKLASDLNPANVQGVTAALSVDLDPSKVSGYATALAADLDPSKVANIAADIGKYLDPSKVADFTTELSGDLDPTKVTDIAKNLGSYLDPSKVKDFTAELSGDLDPTKVTDIAKNLGSYLDPSKVKDFTAELASDLDPTKVASIADSLGADLDPTKVKDFAKTLGMNLDPSNVTDFTTHLGNYLNPSNVKDFTSNLKDYLDPAKVSSYTTLLSTALDPTKVTSFTTDLSKYLDPAKVAGTNGYAADLGKYLDPSKVAGAGGFTTDLGKYLDPTKVSGYAADLGKYLDPTKVKSFTADLGKYLDPTKVAGTNGYAADLSAYLDPSKVKDYASSLQTALDPTKVSDAMTKLVNALNTGASSASSASTNAYATSGIQEYAKDNIDIAKNAYAGYAKNTANPGQTAYMTAYDEIVARQAVTLVSIEAKHPDITNILDLLKTSEAISMVKSEKTDMDNLNSGDQTKYQYLIDEAGTGTPTAYAYQSGGLVGYASGGLIGNGVYGVDSVIARYAGGGAVALAGREFVTQANSVNPATYPVLDHINRTGTVPWPAAPANFGVPFSQPRAFGGGTTVVSDSASVPVLRDMMSLHRTGFGEMVRVMSDLLASNKRLEARMAQMSQEQTKANHHRAIA